MQRAIGKPIPQANTYVVPPPVPEGVPSVASRAESLRVGNVRVAATYAGNALVYRTDDVRLISDPYSRFIAEPGAMLGDQIAGWLGRAGPFRTVTDPESRLPAVLERVIARRVELPRTSPDALCAATEMRSQRSSAS